MRAGNKICHIQCPRTHLLDARHDLVHHRALPLVLLLGLCLEVQALLQRGSRASSAQCHYKYGTARPLIYQARCHPWAVADVRIALTWPLGVLLPGRWHSLARRPCAGHPPHLHLLLNRLHAHPARRTPRCVGLLPGFEPLRIRVH
jgi:hypothetical protein